jgi:urease accessory protein
MNLAVIEEIQKKDPTLDLIIIESGGDNVMTTFSPALADYFIYIVDVSGGDKYPRKGGLGIESCDLLVINKIDLAPHVNADLAIMENDARKIRKDKPFLFVNCKNGNGVEKIVERIVNDLLFDKESTTNQVIEKKVTYNSNQ